MLGPTLTERFQAIRARTRDALAWCGSHLNFFRVHVLVFTFTPLIAACIFYAVNTEVHISFIDALFLCVSSMTVTGLTTINISTANPGQQAIMFFLMCIGNLSAVSVTMVWIRRHFFRLRFDHVVRTSAKARKRVHDIELQEKREKKLHRLRLQRIMGLRPTESTDSSEGHAEQSATSTSSSSDQVDIYAQQPKKKGKSGKRKPLRADMIRRMEGPAFLINPAGVASTAVPEPALRTSPPPPPQPPQHPLGQDGRRSGSHDDSQPIASILNSDSALGGAALGSTGLQPQPSIRISLPPPPPQPVSAVLGLEGTALTESPQSELPPAQQQQQPPQSPPQQHLGAFAAARRPSLSPLAERSQAPLDEHEEAVADIDYLEMPRSAGPTRTRFDDSAASRGDTGPRTRARRVSDPPQSRYRRGSDTGLHGHAPDRHDPFPRAQTVEFAEPHDFRSLRGDSAVYTTSYHPQAGNNAFSSVRSRTFNRDRELDRTMTMRSHMSQQSGRLRGAPLTRTMTSSKQRGFGGFPTPIEIAGMAFKKALPRVQDKLNRTLTMPRTSTFTSVHSNGASVLVGVDGTTKPAPYLSFDATVSGNSIFHELTEAQRDELGGVEYRAIDLLAKLIPAYWLFVNLFMITLVAPYVNSRAFRERYEAAFVAQGSNQPDYTWFWFYQVVSAYTNTGASLVDTSMTTMQDAYFLLIPMGLLILAGNTAFPILLRLFIWCIAKVVPSRSRVSETLQFLLDHPRRCFVYLFPSGQTWFLLFVLTLFNVTDWIAFLVLDIGNPTIESIPVGTRIFDGLFQSIAVRAAGFQVVSLLTLAPAVQFLYVIMMYLSAFPLALSVRSTNVYEEKSLGVYSPKPTDPTVIPDQNDAKVWGTFLASHARRQLAFDIWWLGFALWLICIVERENIEDPSSNGWFTVFSCLFELTSAYGTVGLSTGTPMDSFSLSGRFSTLSKLIVCAVMLRGRHRGLPVAIDRAVLLPSDVEIEDEVMSQFPLDEVLEEDDDEDEQHGCVLTQSNDTSDGTDKSSAPTSAPANVERSGSFSHIRRTMSGVSFVVDNRGGIGKRGSAGSVGSVGSDGLLPSSPKGSHAVYEGRSSSSFQPNSFAAGGASGVAPMSSGLSAIREVPGAMTPTTESRPQSADMDRSFALPPNYMNANSGGGGGDENGGGGGGNEASGNKGKEQNPDSATGDD
ncbi:hypothetical protein ACQY0O_004860 [Thecaphora frezii]